jgi:hypothetical protein
MFRKKGDEREIRKSVTAVETNEDEKRETRCA